MMISAERGIARPSPTQFAKRAPVTAPTSPPTEPAAKTTPIVLSDCSRSRSANSTSSAPLIAEAKFAVPVQATIRRSSGWRTTKPSPSAISTRSGRRAARSGTGARGAGGEGVDVPDAADEQRRDQERHGVDGDEHRGADHPQQDAGHPGPG